MQKSLYQTENLLQKQSKEKGLAKKNHRLFGNIKIFRIVIYSIVPICIFSFVFLDKSRLNKDFFRTMALLRNTRSEAICNDQLMIVRFHEKKITVEDKAHTVVRSLSVPTLNHVNYDTTLGKDMIVFDGHGTSAYNIQVHGGVLALKSWLGFKRNIHVNCTGLAREGIYPAE